MFLLEPVQGLLLREDNPLLAPTFIVLISLVIAGVLKQMFANSRYAALRRLNLLLDMVMMPFLLLLVLLALLRYADA